ncbi:MAG: GNAT family N-acetyltransferase, partial [Candidatus Micrarchaeota archaeon]|nr:GNAT family N-acetyltransferase [Candidatus Micrarchaeota archaeon]
KPWNESWAKKEVESEFMDYFKRPDLNLLVCAAEKGIVGFSVAYRLDADAFPFIGKRLGSMKLAYGDELAVLPEYRNIGIATEMLGMRRIFYESKGYDGLIGRTDIDSRMVSLYETLGFKNTGIQDPKYTKRWYYLRLLRED